MNVTFTDFRLMVRAFFKLSRLVLQSLPPITLKCLLTFGYNAATAVCGVTLTVALSVTLSSRSSAVNTSSFRA